MVCLPLSPLVAFFFLKKRMLMFLLVHFSCEFLFSKLVYAKTKNHSYMGNRVHTMETGGRWVSDMGDIVHTVGDYEYN